MSYLDLMTTLRNYVALNVVWRAAGKPRDGQTRDDMQATRLRFKYALRQGKLIDETARADSMTILLQCNNNVGFCKEVKIKQYLWQIKLIIALDKKILHLCINCTSLTY